MQYIIGAAAGVAITGIVLSIYDLFFAKDDFEEIEWLPLDNHR